MRSPHTTRKSGPRSPQLEKACAKQWRISTAKNKYNFFLRELETEGSSWSSLLTMLHGSHPKLSSPSPGYLVLQLPSEIKEHTHVPPAMTRVLSPTQCATAATEGCVLCPHHPQLKRHVRVMCLSVCVCACVCVCVIFPDKILGRIKRSTWVWVDWFLFLFKKYLFTHLFIWLCWVSFAAHRIFHLYCSMQDLFSYSMQTPSCDMWGLVPWPGIESGSSALEVQSLSHWTTREVPRFVLKKHLLS